VPGNSGRIERFITPTTSHPRRRWQGDE